MLCTLDLLQQQGVLHDPAVACVGFATPAVGNMALSEHVSKQGWQKYITNYLVPGKHIISIVAVSVSKLSEFYATTQTIFCSSFIEGLQCLKLQCHTALTFYSTSVKMH